VVVRAATRAFARALRWAGWTVLTLLAAAGVALSAVALLAVVPFARPLVARALIRTVDDAIDGHVTLEGISVLPQGGVELRGLQLLDPDGHLVLSVGRALLGVDLTSLRERVIGLSVELDRPTVLIEEEADGGTSIARALAPTRRGARKAPEPEAPSGEGGGWTVQLSHVALRGGDLWWQDAAAATRLEARGIDVAARGTIGPRRARVELRLAGRLDAPFDVPVSLQVVAVRAGDGVRVPVLDASAGGTTVSLVAEGDLARRSGRLALTRLAVARQEARELVPKAPAGADLAATGFAASDGASLTAALRLEPVPQGPAGGRADAALAGRLETLKRAVGFDVVVDRLDPSKLAATFPAGEVTLTARGAAAGTSLDDLRARLALVAGRSRLGRAELTHAEVTARAARGNVDVDRLAAALPGARLDGSGHWRRGGVVSGQLTLDAPDLALAARNGAAFAGQPPPPVAGRARVEATLGGTSDAPSLSGRIDAPSLRAGAIALEGARLAVRAAGPAAAPSGTVEGRIAAVRQGAAERIRQVVVRAALSRGEGSASLTASVPAAGDEPVTLDARWALDRARARLDVRHLVLAYPGSRWALAAPASVDLRAPAVDRLELADLPQRLVVEGGVGPRGALAVRAAVSRLDLARLPAGLLPAAGLRGEVSGHVDARGTAERPIVEGRLSVENGGYGRLAGVAVAGEGRWDGAARRVAGTVSVARAEGGTVDAQLDLPAPLAGRHAEAVRVRARAAALPVAELLAAAGRADVPADGKLGLELKVDGTAGAPSAALEVTLADGVWEDLEDLGVTATVEAPGATARLLVSATLAGRRVLAAEASAPLDLGELAARPAETARGLARAPLHATADVLALELAAVSGRAGVPRDLAGVLEAHAELGGTAQAPRVRATAALTGGAAGAWRGLGAQLRASAGDAGLAVDGVVSVQGDEALRVTGTLGLRPERLGDRRALAAAPLHLEASIPRVALGRAAGEVYPLAGTLEGRVTLSGTPRAPELRADLSGAGVAVKGRPLGDATAKARYLRGRGDAEVTLRPPSGGALRATLAVTAALGLDAGGPPLAQAPAEATVFAEDLDLGFLPAVAPGVIRSAGGRIVLDVRASGPLRRMSPRGTLHVADGKLAVVELGEWTGVAIDAKVTDDTVELTRLDVKRGKGTLSMTAAARGLRTDSAALTAHLAASGFTVSRAGMEVATFDLNADATGTLTPAELTADIRIPRGVVRLPKRVPRKLQPLEARKDIVVGRRPERPAPRPAAAPAAAPAPGAPADKPFAYRFHAVAPSHLFVKSDDPKIDLELRADVHYEIEQGEDFASGSVEVVRGSIEPIGGRNFVLDHGAVRFTNGPPEAALLDFQAKYTNPAAVVTAKVTGTLRSPDLKLSSSVPGMTDQDIALLLLTGRTEPKAGSGAVSGATTGQEAGMAVMGVLATQVFKNLVQDKLPLDTVSLDAGGFRAGKYVTDKIYVGYVRRWDADPTKFQNSDEVRVEYQISPRWMFESSYGNAQSGGANLIWSRDY
jgi:translocation and assembly module TamB